MSAIVIPLGIILLLVLANALFVAAEFAIVGAPRASIEHQADRGGRLARRVWHILENPRLQDRYIATTQVGISIASLGLGMYGEHVVAEWLAARLTFLDNPWIAAHVIASVAAVAMLTYLHIVLGEMVPKSLALQRADRTVLYVTPVIEVLERAILPLVVALNAIGNGVLSLFGLRREDSDVDRYYTAEELQLIIRESQESGFLRGEAGQILRELFEFGDMTAGQVMVPRVNLVAIPVGTGSDELRRIVRATPHTRYPVHDGDPDRIVGSIHIKELLRHLVSSQPVAMRDAREVPYIPMTMPLDEVLAAMRRGRAQMVVVMDEHGGTAGIVTIDDLFEEVVGEIDEGRGRAPIWHDPSGRLLVRGTVRLKDVGDALARPFEHAEVQTLSGLVLALLGRPAVLNDVVTWNDVRIEVIQVAGRGVADAALTMLPRLPESQPGGRTPPRTGG